MPIKLSEVLLHAADLVLTGKHAYSCNAAAFAYGYAQTGNIACYVFPERLKVGFLRMGLEWGAIDFATENFRSIPKGPRRQEARALWLTWAALMAEEQGE